MSALRVALALGGVVGAWVQLANAAPPRVESARAARSYAVPLAITYGTSIGLEAALWDYTIVNWHDGAEIEKWPYAAAVVGTPITWLAPGVVHTAYGRLDRGLFSVVGSIGSFAVGALLFTPVWLSLLSKDHPSRDNGYLGTSGRAGVIVLLSAGYLGQALWALDDVSRRGSLASGVPRSAQRLALRQISVVPTRSGATLVAVGGF